MKLSTKAAYLSAFLFPGTGQFFLKNPIKGAIFCLIAGVGLFMMMSAAFHIAMNIADDIVQGKIQPDVTTIMNLVHQAMDVYKQPDLLGAKIAMLGSWITSIIDAYLSGKKKETQRSDKKNGR
jgi:TM2 domain-containing membrane protein YozV